jgi:agmatinase
LEPGELRGAWGVQREAQLSKQRGKEAAERALAYGLQSAPSINDRSIPLFGRGRALAYAGINTFLSSPYLEDANMVGGQDVVVVGAPLDTGATIRPGARFGPRGLRQASAIPRGYNLEAGVDLIECLDIADIGDIHTIPANLEKSFDQIDRGIGHIFSRAVFPLVLGGDHSIGYPDIRGIAPYVDGNIGIIHFDRHVDTAETNFDERMHGTPWFHATNIANAPATNLVQIGIGGWLGTRAGTTVCRERGTTVMTMDDVDNLGVDRVAEIALEVAWKNARVVWLSFDIDCVDPAFAPGTGTPEPGGFLPREILKLLRLVAREGIAGMEVVEVAPQYDVSEITSLLGVRAAMDVLGTLVSEGKLGRRPVPPE